MYFKNGTTSSPSILSIPNCESTCHFDKFVILMHDKIPFNWSKECDAIPLAAITLSTPLLLAGRFQISITKIVRLF